MEAASQKQEPARLAIHRHYAVAPEKVWNAWTEPQALSQWFGPGNPPSVTAAEIDLRVGGRWRIAFHSPGGEIFEVSGVYQEVATNRRLVFSWAWKGTPERVSRISITLSEKDGGCDLDFVHDRFFDEQARINHEGGWRTFFLNLDAYVEN